MTPLYAGIGGVVRELTEMDAGVNGVVTPLTEMWAGVGGVNRQIFSAIKTATWQKWDVKTVYRYTRARRAVTSISSKYPDKWKYYRSSAPRVSSTLFEQRPSDLLELFPTVTTFSASITEPVPEDGYYCVFDDTNYLSLCKFVNLHSGEKLTHASGIDYSLPGSRISYYPEEEVKQKGDNMLGTVSDIEGTYPDNGIQGNYWYVKI